MVIKSGYAILMILYAAFLTIEHPHSIDINVCTTCLTQYAPCDFTEN